MLANQGQAAAVVSLLAPGEKADTAAATSAWVDVRAYEGDLVIVLQVGTVTAGSLTPTIQDATDGSGTGAAGVTPTEGAFTAVTTSNDPLTQKRTIPAGSVRGWIQLVGTIATGPANAGAALLAHPKYT